MDKLPLRSMGYPLGGLTMDPSKGGLALQEASTQHSLQQLSYDPSFAERAAKYSTFGSASFAASQRGSALGGYSAFDTGKLRDVLETESHMRSPANILRSASFSGSQASEDDTKTKSPRSASPSVEALEGASKAAASDGVATSQEISSGSHPPPPQQRKRKGSAAKGNVHPTTSTGDANSTEENTKAPEQTSLKRQRSGTVSNDAKPKAERSASENSGDSSPRSLKGATSKPPKDELPKQDYIHVRARRGQATDSHSLAERVRREKISERMKFLQDLVPGCSKVTGKAVMLDEIINYVQSLQRQIEFLSMKLAAVAVSPQAMEQYGGYDVLGKDVLLLRSPETTLLGPDPHTSGGFGGDLHCHAQLPHHLQHQHQHHPMHHHMAPSTSHLDLHRDLRGVGGLEMCDAYLRRSMSVPAMASLVSADDHFDPLSQLPSQAVSLCNGDLQSVVEMGFIQGRQGLSFGTHLGHGSSMCMTGKLKMEM